MSQIIPQGKRNPKLPFLNERIEEFFTDRECLRQKFDGLLTGSESAGGVLNIHGPDMRGKTALLSMLAVSCRNKNKYVACADARHTKTPEDILCELAGQLEAEGISLATYQKVLKISLESSSPPHPGESQTTDTPDVIASAFGNVIDSPTPKEAVRQSVKVLWSGVQNLLSRNRKRIKQDLNSKGRFTVLSEYFVQDLKELGDQSPQPIVLMLDHFEYVIDPKGELLNWVGALVSDPAFLIVIAGRTPIEYIPRQTEELPPMDDDEIGELVRNYCKAQAIDCPDETKVRNIVKFAAQVPSLAVWAIETCRDRDNQVPDWDIEKFLKLPTGDDASLIGQRLEKLLHQSIENKTTDFSRALEAAAIVRWFDYDILKELVGDVTDNFYHDVKGLPIVFRDRENLSIPEPVREVINGKLRSENPDRYFQLHERASKSYERRLKQLEVDPQHLKNKQTLALENLYHKYQFKTDDVSAKQCAEKYFREAFTDAFNRRQFDFCESLLMQVTLFDTSVTSEAWVRFYRSLMNWYRQTDVEEARRTLEELAQDPTLDDKLLAYLYEVLGWINWYNNDTEKAKGYFERSLDTRQDNPNDVLGRIRVQVWQGVIYQRTEGAGEEYLKPALDLAEKLLAETAEVTGAGVPHKKENAQLRPILAWAHLEFGNSLMLQGRYEEAQQHIKTSIAAYKRLAMRFQHGRALMTYGRLLIYQGKLKEAQDSLLQSIVLFRDFKEPWTDAWAESWLGDVAFLRGDLKAAEEHYISAKTKWAKDQFGTSVADGGLAEVALARGDLDRALEIAEATLQVKKTFEDPFGIAWTENTIGNVLLAKKDAEGAEQAFEEGCQAAKTSRSFLAESLLGLGKCRIMNFRNDETGFAEAAKAVEDLARQHSFFDSLAHLQFLKARLRLRKLAEKGSALSDSDIEGVTQMLLESLTTALHHNVFVLYTLLDQAVEILHSYDAQLTEKGNSVRAMMVQSLRDRWKQTKIDNKTLETLEKRNRTTEIADQLQCKTVLDRLKLVA